MATSVGASEGAAVVRKRVRLELTVHPLTDQRLDALCTQFTSTKGRVVDKLVECLHSAYAAKKQFCVTGRPCRIELTDLPDVF
jgi:hypothetical protein